MLNSENRPAPKTIFVRRLAHGGVWVVPRMEAMLTAGKRGDKFRLPDFLKIIDSANNSAIIGANNFYARKESRMPVF